MNSIRATVSKIESVKSLNIVSFDFHGTQLSMMSLDLDPSVVVGTDVELTAKATHVAIAKAFSGILSYSNQIDAEILSIENGELLSSIIVQMKESTLESVITLNSTKRMSLEVGDKVSVFIKASELSIVRVM